MFKILNITFFDFIVFNLAFYLTWTPKVSLILKEKVKRGKYLSEIEMILFMLLLN